MRACRGRPSHFAAILYRFSLVFKMRLLGRKGWAEFAPRRRLLPSAKIRGWIVSPHAGSSGVENDVGTFIGCEKLERSTKGGRCLRCALGSQEDKNKRQSKTDNDGDAKLWCFHVVHSDGGFELFAITA